MADRLVLEDGTEFAGIAFGKRESSDGEVVFSTAMTGYEQSMTDPSFQGQILTFTYPMIGNYGLPTEDRDEYGILKSFESDEISVRGVIVTEQSESFSHHSGMESFNTWIERKGITGLAEVDTRALTKHLREHGSMRGQIVLDGEEPKPFDQIENPNDQNLVAQVSTPEIKILEPKEYNKTVAVYDFGIKNNILRCFLNRGVRVIQLPWDTDITTLDEKIDGVFFSNGPGDPETIAPTVSKNVQYALDNNIPLWGICLGNQILALSIGAKTKKMKYGNRGVNQPCQDKLSGRCFVTSQNHGYVVDANTLPEGWESVWTNLNDGSCEGIRHASKKAYSVQFHPEACPGPEDSEVLFDEFITQL